MTNVKGEHFEFEKLKPMIQNDKRNSFLWVVQHVQGMEILTSKCTTKAIYTAQFIVFQRR